MTHFVSLLVSGVANGFVYTLIAAGFVLIYKCTRVFNLAQGEITIMGAYVLYALAVQWKLSFGVAFLLTLAFAFLQGLGTEFFVFRPVMGQPILAQITLTLALGGLLRGVMILGWGSDWLKAPALFPSGGVQLGRIANVSYAHLAFVGTSVGLIILLGVFYRYTRTGLAMRATADDAVVSSAFGVRVSRVIAASWVIASLTGAVGGILLTSITGVNYSMIELGFKAMAVALVGGMESLLGIILIGPLLGVIEFLAAGYIDPLIGGGARDLAPYVGLLAVLMCRPYGLFGWKRIERI